MAYRPFLRRATLIIIWKMLPMLPVPDIALPALATALLILTMALSVPARISLPVPLTVFDVVLSVLAPIALPVPLTVLLALAIAL